jgi:uncharacterized membrane protein
MATGWTYITNNGNVPITQIDFSVSVKRYLFGFPVEKSYTYSKTGLNIAPGEKQKVEFSQSIPAEYSGMSTAGDYQFVVSASLDGKEIGSFTKDIKVV